MLVALVVLLNKQTQEVQSYRVEAGLNPLQASQKAITAWKEGGLIQDGNADNLALFVHVLGELPALSGIVAAPKLPKLIVPNQVS